MPTRLLDKRVAAKRNYRQLIHVACLVYAYMGVDEENPASTRRDTVRGEQLDRCKVPVQYITDVLLELVSMAPVVHPTHVALPEMCKWEHFTRPCVQRAKHACDTLGMPWNLIFEAVPQAVPCAMELLSSEDFYEDEVISAVVALAAHYVCLRRRQVVFRCRCHICKQIFRAFTVPYDHVCRPRSAVQAPGRTSPMPITVPSSNAGLNALVSDLRERPGGGYI